MIYLILGFGVILFTISLAYIDRYIIAVVGLLLSAIILAIASSSIQREFDNEFTNNCITSGGAVIETQSGELGCVNLQEM